MKLRLFRNSKFNIPSGLHRFFQTVAAPLRISALLISVISLHLLVVRPLVSQVNQLETQFVEINKSLTEVASHKASLAANNDLLSGLKKQHEDLAAARATVRQLDQLRKEILKESERIPEAMAAVSRISELPEHVFVSEVERHSTLFPVPEFQGERLDEDDRRPAAFPLLAEKAVGSSLSKIDELPQLLPVENRVERDVATKRKTPQRHAWTVEIIPRTNMR